MQDTDTYNWCYYYVTDKVKIYGDIYGPFISHSFNSLDATISDLITVIPYNYFGFVFKNNNYKDIVYKTSNFIISEKIFDDIKTTPFINN